jgi:hypothetical protein
VVVGEAAAELGEWTAGSGAGQYVEMRVRVERSEDENDLRAVGAQLDIIPTNLE